MRRTLLRSVFFQRFREVPPLRGAPVGGVRLVDLLVELLQLRESVVLVCGVGFLPSSLAAEVPDGAETGLNVQDVAHTIGVIGERRAFVRIEQDAIAPTPVPALGGPARRKFYHCVAELRSCVNAHQKRGTLNTSSRHGLGETRRPLLASLPNPRAPQALNGR